LEEISNPSNFGAICRTAEAVGLDGIIIKGGCDIYNPKVLRAAMGALFRLDVVVTDDLISLLNTLKTNSMKIYGSVPDANAEKITNIDKSQGMVCVIGNEGNGISDEVKGFSELVTIPMNGYAESLNAAAAATIIMWEMMR
jgi:TrmH family RNA methyltransferase